MSLKIGSDYSKHLSFLISHLQSNDSSVFVFVNTRGLNDTLCTSLENKIDSVEDLHADVMTITGAMSDTQKYAHIKIFNGSINIVGI